MATEQRPINYGFPASADLSSNQFCAVTVSTGNIALAAAGKNMDGILQDKPNALGQGGAVAMFGVSKALAGGAGYAAGDLLEVVATTGAFQTLNVNGTTTAVAKAITTAAAGVIGTVIILKSNAAYA
jgi:hypothetical protein